MPSYTLQLYFIANVSIELCIITFPNLFFHQAHLSSDIQGLGSRFRILCIKSVREYKHENNVNKDSTNVNIISVSTAP